MPRNKNIKEQARELARKRNISYTAARREVLASSRPGLPKLDELADWHRIEDQVILDSLGRGGARAVQRTLKLAWFETTMPSVDGYGQLQQAIAPMKTLKLKAQSDDTLLDPFAFSSNGVLREVMLSLAAKAIGRSLTADEQSVLDEAAAEVHDGKAVTAYQLLKRVRSVAVAEPARQ